MNQMEVTYQVKGKNNYLVITPPEQGQVITYLSKMAEHNSIPGILPMFCQKIDGNNRFYYEITGRMKLSALTQERQLSAREGEKLLTNLIDGFVKLDRYFMTVTQCILEEDMVFVDSSLATYLPYYPVEAPFKQADKALKEFFLEILGDYLMNRSSNDYYDSLMRFLIRPGFTLEKFRNLVVTEEEREELLRKPAAPPEPVPVPEKKREMQEERPVEKKGLFAGRKKTERGDSDMSARQSVALPTKETIALPTAGILIPGGGVQEEEPEQKKKKKGMFGLWKKKEKSLDLDKGGDSRIADEVKAEPVFAKEEPVREARVAEAPRRPEREYNRTVQIREETGKRTVLLGEEGEARGGYLNYRGRNVEIRTEEFRLGRVTGDLIVDSRHVSSYHATIRLSAGSYYLIDNNSANHTYINGTVIAPYEPVELRDGDTISLAREEMVFRREG